MFINDKAGGKSQSFCLVNRDFGAHNLLVDNQFKICGMIDAELMSVPLVVAAQLPDHIWLDREPPGHVETKPLAIARMKMVRPKFREYEEMVKSAEFKVQAKSRITTLMSSDVSSIYQGLTRCMANQDFVKKKWRKAYIFLLLKRFSLRSWLLPGLRNMVEKWKIGMSAERPRGLEER